VPQTQIPGEIDKYVALWLQLPSVCVVNQLSTLVDFRDARVLLATVSVESMANGYDTILFVGMSHLE
jgi:hypothetical protein